MGTLSVIARYSDDGLYYLGKVGGETPRNDKNRTVWFSAHDGVKKTKIERNVRQKDIVPYGGATSVPVLLKFGDHVLVKIKCQGVKMVPFFPGLVIVPPLKSSRHCERFYSVMLYTDKMVHKQRREIVKISENQYARFKSHHLEGKHHFNLNNIDKEEPLPQRPTVFSVTNKIKIIVNSNDKADEKSPDPIEPDLKPCVGDEVLARWADDGWYHFGVIVESGSGKYRVRDGTGHSEIIGDENILTEKRREHFSGQIKVGNYVIAPHPWFPDSYAPGRVTKLGKPREVNVEFYDKVTGVIPLHSVYVITTEHYKQDESYIKKCEKPKHGHVIARDKGTGKYHPVTNKIKIIVNSNDKADEKSSNDKQPVLNTGGENEDRKIVIPPTEDQDEIEPDLKPRVGDEVLARWADDGWYYFGVIVESSSEELLGRNGGIGKFRVKDGTGHSEIIDDENILTEKRREHFSGQIKVGDCVIAPHPWFPDSYAPGRVTKLNKREVNVEFYDKVTGFIPLHSVYVITMEHYHHDDSYIKKCEKPKHGHVIARDKNTGKYHPGVVVRSNPLEHEVDVQFTNRECSNMINIIHVLTSTSISSCTRDIKDFRFVLAPVDNDQKTFLPAKVTEYTGINTRVKLVFCDHTEKTIALSDCIYLGEHYYRNAVHYFNSKQAELDQAADLDRKPVNGTGDQETANGNTVIERGTYQKEVTNDEHKTGYDVHTIDVNEPSLGSFGYGHVPSERAAWGTVPNSDVKICITTIKMKRIISLEYHDHKNEKNYR